MTQHVEEVLLREPNLWIPKKHPIGRVKLAKMPSFVRHFAILTKRNDNDFLTNQVAYRNETPARGGRFIPADNTEFVEVTNKSHIKDYPEDENNQKHAIHVRMRVTDSTVINSMVSLSADSAINRFSGWYDGAGQRFAIALNSYTKYNSKSHAVGDEFDVIYYVSAKNMYVYEDFVAVGSSQQGGSVISSVAMPYLNVNGQWYNGTFYKYPGADIDFIAVYTGSTVRWWQFAKDLSSDPYQFLIPA